MDAERQRGIAEAILGHTFGRPDLLSEALTHRSAVPGRGAQGRGAGRAPGRQAGSAAARRGAGSNERLEFVGDRVLGLVIAEWLIERYPEEQEGELGRRFAYLVSRPALAEIADGLGLKAALAIAPNEARAGIGALATVLADAMEAVLGALFLDAGLEPARRFIRRAWAGAMEGQVAPPKDAKTALQEWMLGRAMALPVYEETGRTGPVHAPAFTIAVRAAGVVGTGTAGNKREAERLAAADLLGKLT